MSRTGEDNWYFEKYKKYLKYANMSQKENEYKSYKIRKKIEKTFEEVFSLKVLYDLFPKATNITNEFISEFKNAVIENESQQMYEFLKFSQSYYMRKEINPYAITHEIIYQSIRGKKECGLDYDFRDKNGNKIDASKIKKILTKHKDNYDFTDKNEDIVTKEEEIYSSDFPKVKRTITNRITQNIQSENIIRPYQIYLIDEETDCIYKNYCKLFMEIYRPFSERRVQEWINPTSILKKDKNTFCIASLIYDYDEKTIEKATQNNKLSEAIEIKKYQEKILCAISSILKLYNNIISLKFPNTFDTKNLWKNDKNLELYLIEKIFGLKCIAYLYQLNLSNEKTLAVAMLLNPISTMGFNSLHKFIIDKLQNTINEDMANLLINITIHAPLSSKKYYDDVWGNIILEFIYFTTTLRKLVDKLHRILVGDFIKYIKTKRTYENRKYYFEKFDEKVNIEFDRNDNWSTLNDLIKSDKKYLLCALLYNKINYSSNRRILDDEGVHIVDKKKRYGRSDDIEGCINLLYGLTIDPFLLYTDDINDNN